LAIVKYHWLAAASIVLSTTLCVPGALQAQSVIFDLNAGSTLVIASAGSDVLGQILLSAAAACGPSGHGVCVSSGGAIAVLYEGVPVANTLATGITVSEIIGGVTTIAPAPGTLITGAVSVTNTPLGGQVSIALNSGAVLAAGDALIIDGVRGQIVASSAATPGTSIKAQIDVSGSTELFPGTQATVATSSKGLAYVSARAGPAKPGQFTIVYQEGFASAFVQYVATALSPVPANPRPAFGAQNNTEVHFIANGLDGRIEWPAKVPSQLASSGGVAKGGSELQLISQTFDGSQATYTFATANQALSDTVLETFTLQPTVCGAGTFTVQAQLYPQLKGGMPDFNDPLIPSPGVDPVIAASACTPAPLAAISGDNQIGDVGSPLPQPLVVQVQDANGIPVPGVTINFASQTNGAFVVPTAASTDSHGMAQTVATLGVDAGLYTFSASADWIVANFTATAVLMQLPPFTRTRAVPHVVKGGGFLTRLEVINLTAQANPAQVNFLSQTGEVTETESLTVPPNGRFDVASSEAERFGNLTTQWAIVGSNLPLALVAFMDVKSPGSNAPVTAFAFPASDPPLQVATLPFLFAPAAGLPAPLTAGLALANFSSNSNVIDLSLLDALGSARATDSLTLPPFGQTAFDLFGRPAFASVLSSLSQFVGSVVVNSSQPLLLLDAGYDSGQFFTNPVFRQTLCNTGFLYSPYITILPHLPVGGGWRAQVTITNRCSLQNNVTVQAFDQAGNPAQTFFPSSFTLSDLGTAAFSSSQADRSGALSTHWVQFSSVAPVGVQALLDMQPASGLAPTMAVGSSYAALLTRFVLPVDFVAPPAGQSTGLSSSLALANSTNNSDSVMLQLVNSQGEVVAQDTSINLPAYGQTVFSVSDLPGFHTFLNSLPSFSGTLVVTTSQPTSPLAVGFDFGRSFTVPVFDLNSIGP
jgi:hypothetical protein